MDYPSWSDEKSYAEVNSTSWTNPPRGPPPAPAFAHQYDQGYRGPPGGYGGAPAPAPQSYVFSGSAGFNSDRPRFSDDGRGEPFSGGGHVSKMVDSKNPEVSYDTSSRDPALLRARVFIGSLGKGAIVREDIIELCRPFGSVLAVTLFKQGYAFVQFSDANEADDACEALNNKRWKGVTIDVHLAMEGLVKKTLPAKRPAAPTPPSSAGRGSSRGGGGGGGRDEGYGKRARTGGNVSAVDDEAFYESEVNERNKKSAADDKTMASELVGTEMADTLICGTCRMVTADFVAFREHRKKTCVKPKESIEPPVLKCASCGLRFLTAWRMLFHLTDFHRMQLFKPDYTNDAVERAKVEEDKYRKIQDERMKEFEEAHMNEEAKAFDPTGGTESTNGTTAKAGASGAAVAKKEKVTTGADYDEDEEDDEDPDKPTTIPTIG